MTDQPKDFTRWQHKGMVLRIVVVLVVSGPNSVGERYVVWRPEDGLNESATTLDRFLTDYAPAEEE